MSWQWYSSNGWGSTRDGSWYPAHRSEWGHDGRDDGWSGSGFEFTGWVGGRGGKKEKNYKEYSHLGLGRHKLPHEDRGILASMLFDKIFEDTGIKMPNLAVASWKEPTCNAFFYLLAHAQPSSRLQQMVPRGEQVHFRCCRRGALPDVDCVEA